MALVQVQCAHCDAQIMREAGHVNRSAAKGMKLFCNRVCFGLDRRIEKSKTQKVAEKAEYDRMYREREAEKLKAKKASYYQRTADRDKERAARQRRMPQHVEYCRRPEYKEWKKEYDRKYRAVKFYGPFSEAFLALQDLETEVAERASRYEIYSERGTLCKTQKRKREYEKAVGC